MKFYFVIAVAISAFKLSAGDVPSTAQLILKNGDKRVGTYISSHDGFETSSYWIEGPAGLLFIDTQFLPSAAEEALTWAEGSTGKKVELAIVLHPNPDKFNGTGLYKKRGIKVVTSDQVLKHIPHVHEIRTKAFFERYRPDYPTTLVMPDSFGNATKEISAGGVTVTAHVLGRGCSEAHVVVEFENHLFPGDLITNGNHAWLELGLVDEWLKRLEEIQAMEPEFIHPGRGPTGDDGLIERQRQYLVTVRDLVKAAKPTLPVNKKTAQAIVQKLYKIYPGYGFPFFAEFGVPAVWEAMAAALSASRAMPNAKAKRP